MDPQATQLVLDTRDLTIAKVEGAGRRRTVDAAAIRARRRSDPILGSKLTIQAPQRNPAVRITYATSPDASGLQWLAPAMTEGKQQPFMFSQSEAIHARSWVPLQDTPGVRFTYSAHVTAPQRRDGADERGQRSRGRARWRLPLPHAAADPVLPAGDRSGRPGVPADLARAAACGPSRRWCSAAATEFADTER